MPDSEERNTMPDSDVNIQAVFDALDKLAARGFEFFIGGLGLVLLGVGFFVSPMGPISEREMLIVAASGAACILASMGTWFHKTNIKTRINVEKIAYQRFVQRERTIRLIATNQDPGSTDGLEEIT